jgi:Protein of unknown function (DUF2470)
MAAIDPKLTSNGSTTSSKDRKDAAVHKDKDSVTKKARIITHLNTDHADSLSLYLQHYCDLSPSAAEYAKLVDISLSSLTIESSDGTAHIIPLEPPMTSWRDARARTVEMDRDARSALGLSAAPSPSAAKVIVEEYIPPSSPLHIFMICLVVFFLGSIYSYKKGWLVRGTWFWENVMKHFPGGPAAYLWTQNWLGVPAVVGLHAFETVWMVRKLGSHGVRGGSGVWWAWVGSTLFEGFGPHQRFNGLVRREEGKRKH